MTVTVPVAPSRICAERGCRTVLSIWNPLDKCSLHVERHIMPNAGHFVRMVDGLPPIKQHGDSSPPRFGRCETCGRILSRRGCVQCDVTPAVLEPEVIDARHRWKSLEGELESTEVAW